MSRNILFIIGVLLLIISSVFTYFYLFNGGELLSEGEEESFKTSSENNTAKQYFPDRESEFLDFREDGADGDFEVVVTLRDKGVEVRWDQSVDVYEITVQDMGAVDDLDDHEMVYSNSTKEERNSTEGRSSYVISQYFSSPYTIGTDEALFNTDHRYSVELRGFQNERGVSASYTFTYAL